MTFILLNKRLFTLIFLVMAVDRTSELLSCLGTASSTLPTAAAARATSERGGEEVSTSGTVSSTLKNRHRRERFALEDQKSPSLSEAVLSDSDMERGTPPATFISMACSVVLALLSGEDRSHFLPS